MEGLECETVGNLKTPVGPSSTRVTTTAPRGVRWDGTLGWKIRTDFYSKLKGLIAEVSGQAQHGLSSNWESWSQSGPHNDPSLLSSPRRQVSPLRVQNHGSRWDRLLLVCLWPLTSDKAVPAALGAWPWPLNGASWLIEAEML